MVSTVSKLSHVQHVSHNLYDEEFLNLSYVKVWIWHLIVAIWQLPTSIQQTHFI